MYKLNSLDCGGWQMKGADAVEFSMACAYAEVSGLKGAESLKVTDGDGTELADFSGYELVSQWESDGSVRARFLRKLEANTEAAIRSLEANMVTVSKKVDEGMAEASKRADEAASVAGEAKAIAEQAGTDPQVEAFARMAVKPMAADMTVSEGASVSTLWPERKVGDKVKLKDFFWYGGELYRCNQPDLTITAGQTPDMNLPALYGHVSVASDGILVWDADDLSGAPDIYNTGVKVHRPDADGPVYVSKRDGNTSEPGTDRWWELAE